MATPGETIKGWATAEEQDQFISMIAPIFQKYSQQYGFKLVSFAIAQACFEGGWGFSADSVNLHNLLGIGPHKYYDSWDSCIKGYYTDTVLGGLDSAKSASTLDQYYQAFVESGYLGGDGQAAYYESIKSIISSHDLTKYDGTSGGSFQSNVLEDFVQKALSYKGTGSLEWSRKHPKWYDAGVWCADFVSAVGEEVGVLGKVFDGSASAYVCAHSSLNYGGEEHTESSYSPQRGDLINFMWGGGAHANGYADHIGIVTRFEDGVVYTIEGNTSDMVAERSYSRSSSVLACFCHPNWGVPGTSGAGIVEITGNLFDELNTREDAILRESAYLDVTNSTEYKATISQTSIALSIINYTELFQTFWEIGAANTKFLTSGNLAEFDYSKIDPQAREVIQYLTKKGLNNAAACGIAGNIYHESRFNTGAIGDNGTSFGICQWHLGRGDSMKHMAGSNWATNLTGQLDYLWYELETNYNESTLSVLKSVENTESGCKKAADIFVRKFEIPADVDNQSLIRQETALKYFNNIVSIVVSKNSFSSLDMNNLSPERRKRIERAKSQYGKPYVWGAVGPDSFDCSGFVSYCLSGENIRLGTTYTFLTWPHTTNPQPGDICVNEAHCGLYVGDGKMIHCSTVNGVDGVQDGTVQSGMVYVTYNN